MYGGQRAVPLVFGDMPHRMIDFEKGRPKGVRKWGVLGLKTFPLSMIFYRTLLPTQRILIVFAYFLLVTLST